VVGLPRQDSTLSVEGDVLDLGVLGGRRPNKIEGDTQGKKGSFLSKREEGWPTHSVKRLMGHKDRHQTRGPRDQSNEGVRFK